MFQKKNIIVFAAGGGNDIFSAVAYVKSYLSEYFFDKIAIVGVLGFTPFHSTTPLISGQLHTEPPLVRPTADMKRYLMCNPPREIGNNEKLLPGLLQELAPEITNFVCMSPKYSALEQAENLRKLFAEWDMLPDTTLINVVDFGGDILTNGLQSSVISPDLDAYTLAVAGNLTKVSDTRLAPTSTQTPIPTLIPVKPYLAKVSVCFPGIDGELPSHYLTGYCQKNSIRREVIDSTKWTTSLKQIEKYLTATGSQRMGNTIPNMISALQSFNVETAQRQKLTISKQWVVGQQKAVMTKVADINWELLQHVHMFNLSGLLVDNPFVSVYNLANYELTDVVNTVLAIYKPQTKHEFTVQSSDLHLQYIRNDLYGKWSNKQLIYVKDTKPIQEVMLVDVFPPVISLSDKNKLEQEVKSGLAVHFDSLYTQKKFAIKK